MITFLVFAALLVAVSSSPIDSKGISSLLELGDDSPICREETAKLKTCFSYGEESNAVAENLASGGFKEASLNISEKLKEGLKCLGEVECSKIILFKFGVESYVFAIEKIFTEGNECTSQIDFESSHYRCTMAFTAGLLYTHGGVSVLGALGTEARPITRCVTKTPKCGDVPRKAFIQGIWAIADFLAKFLTILAHAKNHSFDALNSFNKTFNPTDFDDPHFNFSEILVK